MVGRSKEPDRAQDTQMEVLEQAQLMARAMRAANAPTIKNRLGSAVNDQYERLYGASPQEGARLAGRERQKLQRDGELEQGPASREDLGRNAFAVGAAGAPMGSNAAALISEPAATGQARLIEELSVAPEAVAVEGASPQSGGQRVEDLRTPAQEAPSWIDLVEKSSGLSLARTGVVPSVRLDEQLKRASEGAFQFELFKKLTRLPETLDPETRGVIFIANAALIYVILCTAKKNELAAQEVAPGEDIEMQPLEYGRSVMVRHEGQEILEFDPLTVYSSDSGALAI